MLCTWEAPIADDQHADGLGCAVSRRRIGWNNHTTRTTNLSVPGATVEIRLEISATAPAGFDEAKQRVVRENGAVLGFDNSEFERE